MQIQQTNLPDVVVIEPQVFADERGFFQEIFQRRRYTEAGIDADFVQDNYSRSAKGTLRGLHFQFRHAQGKLVQCLRGEIFDVAVDLRRYSPNFGNWVGVLLSESNHRQVYIPPGFAHGFYVVSELAEMYYKCDDYFDREQERSLLWNDPAIGIDWPLSGEPILSEKDRRGIPLSQIECYEQPPR